MYSYNGLIYHMPRGQGFLHRASHPAIIVSAAFAGVVVAFVRTFREPDAEINSPAPALEGIAVHHRYTHMPNHPKTRPSISKGHMLSPARPLADRDSHHRLPRPPTHTRTKAPHVPDLTNALRQLSQNRHVPPCFRLKQPDPAVVPARDEEVLVELEGGHARVVSGDALQDGIGFERECDDAAV